jgi:hypothetical protein
MLSQEELRELFEYDESSPSCLRWKGHKVKSVNGRPVGSWYPRYNKFIATVGGKKIPLEYLMYQFKYGGIEDGDTLRTLGEPSDLRKENLILYKKDYIEYCYNARMNMEWWNVFDIKDGKLYWKIPSFGGRSKGSHVRTDIGESLKWRLNQHGYVVCNIRTRSKNHHYYHKIMWETANGRPTGDNEVDHIDRDKLNCDPSNLRLATRNINSRNRSMSANNTSGVTGVHYSKDDFWTARYNDADGVRRCKKFSVKQYGWDKAFEMACEYRKEKIEYLNEIYGDEGYTETHGLKLEDN